MLAKLLKYIAEAKKAAVGLVGVASILAASGQLTGTVGQVVEAVLAVGTVLGVYHATNAPADEADTTAHAG